MGFLGAKGLGRSITPSNCGAHVPSLTTSNLQALPGDLTTCLHLHRHLLLRRLTSPQICQKDSFSGNQYHDRPDLVPFYPL